MFEQQTGPWSGPGRFASRRLRTPHQATELTPRRVQQMRQRILTGFYERPEIAEHVLELILIRGDVQPAGQF